MIKPKVIINKKDSVLVTIYGIKFSLSHNSVNWHDEDNQTFTRDYLNEQYNNGNLIINYIKRN